MPDQNPFAYLFPDRSAIDSYLAGFSYPRQDILSQSLTTLNQTYVNTSAYYRDPSVSTDFGNQAIAQGLNSAAFGAFSFASHDYSTAVGYKASAIQQFTVAIGEESAAAAYAATAVGRLAVINGIKSTGVGAGVYIAAASNYSTAVGHGALSTTGTKNTVVGQGSSANGDSDTIVGQGVSITVDSGTGVGQGVSVTGVRSTVVGQGAASAYADCVVVGNVAVSTAAGQVIIGSSTSTVSQIYLGRGVTHTGAAQNMEIHASDGASGGNIAGDNVLIYGGASYGTSAGGYVSIYTAPSGTATTTTTSVLNSFSPDTGVTLMTSMNAYWALDDTATPSQFLLDSAGSNNLTNVNAVASVAGKVNKAAQFVAASSKALTVVPNTNLQISGNFTFVAWVYLDSIVAATDMCICSQLDNISGNFCYNLYLDGATSKFRFRVLDSADGADSIIATTFGVPSTATWYMVGCYRDGTNIGISVNNGTFDTTASSRTINNNATVKFRIGANGDGSRNPTSFWDGRIDEVGFWKKKLSAQEFTDLYNAGAANARVITVTTTSGYSSNAAVERLRVDSGGISCLGDIWMGLASHTSGSSTRNLRGSDGSGSNIAGDNVLIYGGSSTGSATGGYVAIFTTPSGSAGTTLNTALERLRINSSGAVDLSATSPAQFVVSKTGTIPAGVTGNGIVIHNSSAAPFILLTDADSNAAAFSISVASGNCTLAANRTGSGAYGTMLRYASATLYETLSTAGAFRWHAYGAGALTTDGSGNITAVSDERLKDIQGLLPYGLDALLKIHPILYKWKPFTNLDQQYVYPGFSAQEVQAVIPEAVLPNRVGHLGLQDRGILGACVNAIQELASRVAVLEAK